MRSHLRSGKRSHCVAALLALAVSFGSVLLLSGCTRTPEPAEGSAAPPQGTADQGAQPESSQTIDLDASPEPLEEPDAAQSLEGYGAAGALADQDLSIRDMLAYAVQDEYLARGEYAAIIGKFGNINPYANIVRAEETHLSFLKSVYDAYGLAFPEDTSADHITVPADLLEAAKIGVKAEVDNIAMYELFLTYELPDNVKEVFTALKEGSESHLLAFQKQVERLS